ncbi:hypothetical protein, partial [Duncaniella muris]|uniref:hypothetical protein n=1 Tax=Duncaniella muris TaxID=2094150 RepID=UPI0026750EDE
PQEVTMMALEAITARRTISFLIIGRVGYVAWDIRGCLKTIFYSILYVVRAQSYKKCSLQK